MKNKDIMKNISKDSLWFLRFYASTLFEVLKIHKISIEKYPKNIPNLVAKILSELVERRIRRNLSYGYKSKVKILGHLQGKIELLETERHYLLDRVKIACRVEELVVDTPRNRFVRDALDVIANYIEEHSQKNITDSNHIRDNTDKLIGKCRGLANYFRRLGVTGERPSIREITGQWYGINDREDRPMLEVALFVFQMVLPIDSTGKFQLPKPKKKSLAKLFESGIRGFYCSHLSPEFYTIKNSERRLKWTIENNSSEVKDFIPSMYADIIIEYRDPFKSHCIIIDAKFTSILGKGRSHKEGKLKFKSSNIYQIYSYLRSQEGKNGNICDNASGLLLYPMIDKPILKDVVIQNHKIRFATIDLNESTDQISRRLIKVIEGL